MRILATRLANRNTGLFQLFADDTAGATGTTPGAHIAEIVCRAEPSLRLADFARRHGTTTEVLLNAYEAAAPVVAESQCRLTLRPRESPANPANVTTHAPDQLATAVRNALAAAPTPGRAEWGGEWVVEWHAVEHAAILDVDWHKSTPPPTDIVTRIAASLRPRPIGWWVSHGGGLHALYGAADGIDAGELAAVAARQALRLNATCSVEVLHRTSHPLTRRNGKLCDAPTWAPDPHQHADLPTANNATADPTDVEAWLAARGWGVGDRHAHEQCVVEPGPSHGTPVIVTADGVMCHRCQAMRGNGFRSWGALLGVADDPLVTAARYAAIWPHVRYTLADARLSNAVGKLAYSALLKRTFGAADPRVGAVFQPWAVVRADGVWLDGDSLLPVLPAVGVEVTRSMPSAWRVVQDRDAEGNESYRVETDAIKHDLHRTNQSIPGYTPLVPMRCAPLWGAHRPFATDAVRVRRPTPAPFMARYLAESDRVPALECESRLLAWFPGLSLNYLQALIAARGHAESGFGDPPQFAVTGVTGAAKTTTVLLAAAIVGDLVQDVRYGSAERFSEAIADAAAQAGFILLDEYAKGMKPTERLEAFGHLLTIRREYTFRRLRVGNVRVRVDSVLVVTDTDLGDEIRQHAQYARRVVNVRLLTRCPHDWRKTGPVKDDVLRLRHDRTAAHTADSYLSWVADGMFGPQHATDPVWVDSARRVGLHLLEEDEGLNVAGSADSDGATSTAPQLIAELFRLACSMPDVTDVPTWRGRGWKALDVDQPSALLDTWTALAGGNATNINTLLRIRRLRELDIGRVLGVTGEPVMFDASAHGRRIGFRFRCGNGAAARLNGEIIDPAQPDPTHEPHAF